MREIKFRIWDRQAKAWEKNDCSLHCFSNWQIDPFTGQLTDFVGAIDGDRETRYNGNPAPDYYLQDGEIVNEPRYVLVQFTGLKDKNGREIYEGDIVKVGYGEYEDALGQMIFEYGCFMLTSKYGCNFMDTYQSCLYGEVVGNVFENPELLEE